VYTHDVFRFGFLRFGLDPTVLPKSMVEYHILLLLINTANTCYWVIDKRRLTKDCSSDV